ncbi:MAG: TetR/AcrR family transcriptional regulator [Gemmatimonadaceae bacterium]
MPPARPVARKKKVAGPRKDAAPAPPDAEQRILDAARRVFIRRGTAGARMQEIADEAGVNQALLHYYYRSKARLAERVFLEAAGRLFAAVAPALTTDAPLEELIEQFVHRYIDEVRNSPFIPGYVLAELHHNPERVPALLARATGGEPSRIARAALDGLRARIAARVAAGTMRPVTPEQLLVTLTGSAVFPFAARPLLTGFLGMDGAAFDRFLDQRRTELPAFILNALRP